MDCCAAMAIAMETEDGVALNALLEEKDEVIAPLLFTYELSNSLWKYVKSGLMSLAEATQNGNKTMALIDEFIDNTGDWNDRVVTSLELNHPTYDMSYLLLARKTGSTLFTLDQKLQKLCLENGVECIYTDKEFFTRELSKS